MCCIENHVKRIAAAVVMRTFWLKKEIAKKNKGQKDCGWEIGHREEMRVYAKSLKDINVEKPTTADMNISHECPEMIISILQERVKPLKCPRSIYALFNSANRKCSDNFKILTLY